MRYFRSGLVAVLLFAVVVRIAADLLAPVLPWAVALLLAVGVAGALLGRPSRW